MADNIKVLPTAPNPNKADDELKAGIVSSLKHVLAMAEKGDILDIFFVAEMNDGPTTRLGNNHLRFFTAGENINFNSTTGAIYDALFDRNLHRRSMQEFIPIDAVDTSGSSKDKEDNDDD